MIDKQIRGQLHLYHVPVRVGIVWKFYTSYGKKDGGTTVEKNYFANAPPRGPSKKISPAPFLKVL